MKLFRDEFILIFIMCVLSIMNIVKEYEDLLSFTVFNSALGLAATVCFIFKIRAYLTLTYFWIFLQILIIHTVDLRVNPPQKHYFLDASQMYSFNLGFHAQFSQTVVGIGINLLPFIYFSIFKLIKISSIAGKEFTFSAFKHDSEFSDNFPLKGVAERRMHFFNEKDWLLFRLEKQIEFEGTSVSHALVKDKEGGIIKQRAKNQIVFFRMVLNEKDLNEKNPDLKIFPFLEWIRCE